MKIYLCGDSTACDYPPERAPQKGWGQYLGGLLPEGCEVINAARGGRSTKSFLAEGRLQAIEKTLAPGDLLLIQFSHNDESDLVWRHTEPYISFANNLCIFIDTARLAGAVPVLLTPICRRVFEGGVLQPTHGVYPDVIRALAVSRAVPLIDLYQMSCDYVSAMGDEASKAVYMHFAPGEHPRYPEGLADNSHTKQAAAETYAGMAARALVSLGLVK